MIEGRPAQHAIASRLVMQNGGQAPISQTFRQAL